MISKKMFKGLIRAEIGSIIYHPATICGQALIRIGPLPGGDWKNYSNVFSSKIWETNWTVRRGSRFH